MTDLTIIETAWVLEAKQHEDDVRAAIEGMTAGSVIILFAAIMDEQSIKQGKKPSETYKALYNAAIDITDNL